MMHMQHLHYYQQPMIGIWQWTAADGEAVVNRGVKEWYISKRRKRWDRRASIKCNVKWHSLGAEWAMYKVEIPPLQNLDNPNALVAGIKNINNNQQPIEILFFWHNDT